MDQVHVIRHKVLVEHLSRRSVAEEMGVSRNTVARYLERSAPERVELSPRSRPKWEKVKPRFVELVESSSTWTSGKQRLTATRLHDLLRGEGFDVGASMIKEALAEWKRQRREVFVPLVYHPGELAQVDFFEVIVEVANEQRKAWLFVMRLMHSGRDFGWLYDRQDQISFLDAHVRAFAHLGAVPQRIAYDNLKLAVVRVLVGSTRELTARFQALASHYLFEPSFCRPGTGHDKGGVEARGRLIRLQQLVPIPKGDDLETINQTLLAKLDDRMQTARNEEGRTIAERFGDELGKMLPLNERDFDARATQLAIVSRRSLVRAGGATYSVPCEWAQLDVTVHVGPTTVEIVGPTGSAHHPRCRFGRRSIDYRHYLPELAKKPQAVRQVAAELMRDLGEPFGRVWRELVDIHGPSQASRVFSKVLERIIERGVDEVARIVIDALAHDRPLLMALAPDPDERVMEAVPGTLAAIDVPSGVAADYDEWLVGGAR